MLLVDAEDTWTQMLAHMVRHVGMVAEVRRWEQVDEADVLDEDLDLVLYGPGPGDPADQADERVVRLRDLLSARLEAGRPVLAVCLSHQVLADLAVTDAPAFAALVAVARRAVEAEGIGGAAAQTPAA